MSWNYTNPNTNDRDKVRFLVGDTCSKEPLVTDEEIAWALSEFSDIPLASALICRGLAAKFSREVSTKVGDVSRTNVAAVAKAFADRAKELDPLELTLMGSDLVLPSFGGLSLSEKETLSSDTDAVQPSFRKGANDIPGGPDDQTITDYDWIR